MNKVKQLFSTRNFKHGSYSVGISVVVIAIVIVVNLILGQLPQAWTNIDMSTTKIYTTGDVTKEVVDGLETEVEIHIIAQEANIDTRIRQFVEHYADLSSKISYDIIDPVVHPTILQTYGVSENCVVVECPETGKTTSFGFGDMIAYDQMSYYYYGEYIETEFDGEGLMTSAVDYVTNDVSKKVYLLEGHGESSLDTSISGMLEKQNFRTDTLNLITDALIPEDCDMILINAAATDIAEDEKVLLEEYMAQGGNMMIILGDNAEDLTNLNTFMAAYGMTPVAGYIADAQRYYQTNMFNIFPEFTSGNGITDDMGSDALALVSQSKGFSIGTPERDTIAVTEFMTTSDNGYAVDDESEIQGTYTLGAYAEETIDEETTSRLTVIGSATLIADKLIQSFPSIVNADVFMNAVTACFDDVSNISIAAKSLEVTNNTVANGGLFGIIFIAVIPLAVLITGFVHWMQRRKA